MNRCKALSFLPVLLLAALSLASCSGPKTTCTVNCGGSGNGSVAVTMVADTLPASPSLLTFQVTIASIKFTTSSGTSTTVNLNPALTVDLMRLQTDTVFLGLFPNIPAAQYVSATLFFSGNAKITFLNDSTTATISLCPPNTVCPLSVPVSSTPIATVPFTVSPNAVTGIGIDLNFFNAVSISGSPANLVVNFNNANVLSAFTLPRPNSNLAAGQLDLIEDFTGVVSISNQSVTLASAPVTGRGSLTASATSTTFYDPDPYPLPDWNKRIGELRVQQPSRQHGCHSQVRWNFRHPGNRTALGNSTGHRRGHRRIDQPEQPGAAVHPGHHQPDSGSPEFSHRQLAHR